MIKKKLEISLGGPCSSLERLIPKPTSFMCTKSNPPGFFTQLLGRDRKPALLGLPRLRQLGCMNGPGNQLTGKKLNPWVVAISAHNRLT
jgi:hypothetical protein